ncbi:hypothetical protein LIER_10014 [Lithospermum erythrorhizon]|uniref:Peptidase A1 domain-containing protein n=1 Tax=Lithospermum erythrorhizon TaxID=34254 RepID=A0AAV3PJG4_LITER
MPSKSTQRRKKLSTWAPCRTGGGNSRNSRKNYAWREVYSFTSSAYVCVEPISFFDAELGGIEVPHDDSIIIAPVITNYTVDRMLVDMGSSVDILYLSR